jgi:hypothetical protein
MSCYVVAPDSATPNAICFLMSRVIADAEYHALSSWVDSICLHIQPAARIIHSIYQFINRGAAGGFFDFTRSGDITPELTGRESTSKSFKFSMTIKLIPLRLNELLGCAWQEAFNFINSLRV